MSSASLSLSSMTSVASRGVLSSAVRAAIKSRFPEVEGRAATRELTRLISGSAAFDVQKMVVGDPKLIGTTEEIWLLASDAVDLLQKGHVDRQLPADQLPCLGHRSRAIEQSDKAISRR